VAIFPLVILAQRNAIELQNNMPTMQRLQERMILARRSGDHVGGKFELLNSLYCLPTFITVKEHSLAKTDF
jgi:hypothetical protein